MRIAVDEPVLLHALEGCGFDVHTLDEDGRVIRAIRPTGRPVVARVKLRDPGEAASYEAATLSALFVTVMEKTQRPVLEEMHRRLHEQRAALREYERESGDVGFKIAMELRRREQATCGIEIPGVGVCELAQDGHAMHRRGAVAWNGGPPAVRSPDYA